MADDTRQHLGALMRDLALAVQRLASDAAQQPDEAPGDRVRKPARIAATPGAGEERTAAWDPALVGLLVDAGKALAHFTHEAASRPEFRPGQRVELATEAALRFMQELGRPLPAADALGLDRPSEPSERSVNPEAPTQPNRSPEGRRAELLARVARAALVELEASLPQLERAVQRMVPLTGELAGKIGEGPVQGAGAQAGEAALQAETLVNRAARTLVHAFARQVAEEWRAHPVPEASLWRALGAAVEAVATVVAGGVGERTARFFRRPQAPDATLRASPAEQAAERALDAMGSLGKRLWHPATAAAALAGAGGLAIGFGLRALRRT